MKAYNISWKNIWSKPLAAALNLMLIAFGAGILTILILASNQVGAKLESNARDIDLVIGAKGSPLQLVLSSIYYIDFPTGNIPLNEAKKLMDNPMVKRAVPLALGDNYNGVRIVGTDTNFISLHSLKLATGKFWSDDFETTIGSTVAKNQNLKIGDKFYGAHGLTGSSDVHKAHAYRVSGILEPRGNATDNLILTSIPSVWHMHDEPEDEHHHGDGRHHHEHGVHSIGAPDKTEELRGKELTSILIQYRSPMAVATFPRMVNESTNMQAASPAQESTRLFSLIGVGIDVIQWFAILIMVISAASVFVNLYNSLKDREYDLAIMRTLGASKVRLFFIVITEGVFLGLAGSLMGMLLGHIGMNVIGHFQESEQVRLSGLVLLQEELYLLLAGLIVGIAAGLLPAIQAYRTNISEILAKS